MRLGRVVAVATIVWIAGAASAQGENLLVNGDFDEDYVGWFMAPSWVLHEWSHEPDVNGVPTSGSLRQENVNDDGIKAGGMGQCVSVTPGQAYRFGGSTYVPSGQAAEGGAGIHFQWKGTPDCTDSGIGGAYGTDGVPGLFDAWYSSQSDWLVAPATAHSAQIDLVSRKYDAAGTFVAYWDGLFVVPEASATSLAIASLAALGLVAGRRDRIPRAGRIRLPPTPWRTHSASASVESTASPKRMAQRGADLTASCRSRSPATIAIAACTL